MHRTNSWLSFEFLNKLDRKLKSISRLFVFRSQSLTKEDSDFIPFAQVSPDFHKGKLISGYCTRDGINLDALSDKTKIPVSTLIEMKTGSRAIDEQSGKKLAEAFNVDAKVFE